MGTRAFFSAAAGVVAVVSGNTLVSEPQTGGVACSAQDVDAGFLLLDSEEVPSKSSTCCFKYSSDDCLGGNLFRLPVSLCTPQMIVWGGVLCLFKVGIRKPAFPWLLVILPTHVAAMRRLLKRMLFVVS